mgnify:CR=1 FL=1
MNPNPTSYKSQEKRITLVNEPMFKIRTTSTSEFEQP